MSGSGKAFSAAASALGYAYQFRYSLVVALRRLRRELAWQISLETADDVEVSGSSDTALLQLKHRAKTTPMTDVGADLWKTLRVWSEGIKAGRFDPMATEFLLVTTAELTPGTAVAQLSSDKATRDEDAAKATLKQIAGKRSNKALAPAYTAFSRLTDAELSALLESMTILTRESDISQLDEDLRDLCFSAARREHLVPFLERLEGWWFRRCLQQLAQPNSQGILAEELDSFFTDLREQFRELNLPIDWDIELIDAEVADFGDKTFVHQLRMLSVSDKRVGFAVRDYLKAFTQRSRWARDGLLLVGELDRYERQLVAEWDRMFTRMVDNLGPESVEAEKTQKARELYDWVESVADFRVRPECSEPFVARGSYQLLADGRRVGWHPDFMARLVGLLEPASK